MTDKTKMIDAIAERDFTHGDESFAAEQALSLAESQFNDWLACGLVKRAPKKAEQPAK